jgi:hypothetical protein
MTNNNNNNNNNENKLEKLTPSQEREMYQFRDDYIDSILNNGGSEYESFSSIYNKIKYNIWWRYEKANLPNKKPLILIADSYLEEKLMINFVRLFWNLNEVRNQVRDQVVDQVFDQVRDQVRDQVGSQVRSQVGSQVFDQVGDQVRDQVVDQVFDQVRGQVRDQVVDQVFDQVRGQVVDQVGSQVRSQVGSQVFDQVGDQVGDQVREQVKNKNLEFIEQYLGLVYEYWISFYEYFKKIGIVKSEEFDKYIQPYIEGKIWSIQFFENFVFMTRLPKKVCRDSSNRLHSVTEAAVQWNGFDYMGKTDMHFLHGVYFEKDEWSKIVKNEISVKELLEMENKEKQRAALSVYSIEKLIKNCGATVEDIYKNPRDGNEIHLLHIPRQVFGLDEDLKYLKYKDPSTDRIYISGVPPNMQNARIAMAWKFSLTVEEYEQELEVET